MQWSIRPTTLLNVQSVQIHLHPLHPPHPITVATCETEINYYLQQIYVILLEEFIAIALRPRWPYKAVSRWPWLAHS